MKHFYLFWTLLLPFCLSAQLIESFDGEKIDSHYPWQGDTAHFKITEEKELRLNTYATKSEKKLYIRSVSLLGNTWEGKVRSGYPGTAYNCFHFYLWCENANPAQSGYALLLRMGNSKNIDLRWKRGNISENTLITGRTLFEKANQDVYFRVTTDQDSLCTLYSKTEGDTDYVEEGKVTLDSGNASGYYMIVVKYSGDHAKNKYIDDLFIESYTPYKEEPPTPTDPPRLTWLEQDGDTAVILTFDQPVYANEGIFVLSELGRTDIIYQTDDGLLVRPVWPQGFTDQQTYTLSYSNLYDANRSSTFWGECSFTAVCKSFAKGSILFNEIMADPNLLTALPQTEYVELQNLSGEAIEMEGWTFVYDSREVTLKQSTLLPDHYLILYREGQTIATGDKGKGMPLQNFPAQLANDGKRLQLKDPTGKLIDEITYGKAIPGKSWERGTDGWYLSTDSKGGTPGSSNSDPYYIPEEPEPEQPPVAPFTLVFNELLPNPYTNEEEYIELYNRSGEEIALTGLAIATRKSDGSLNTSYHLTPLPPIQAGAYLLLSKSAASVARRYTILYPEHIHEVKLPILNNEGSNLVLFRTADGVVIDEVSYSPQWHDSSIKENKGVALERIDPDKPTQDETNWTSAAATAGHGTPGYRNSQYLQPKDDDPSGIEKPLYSKETESYSIQYDLEQAGYKCRGFIYDLSGRIVSEINNNELLGSSGSLTWNGKGKNGEKLPPEPYILYIELYHDNGDTKRFKEVFLVY
ncbi:lamin tail domain-containing protein [Parabacteroides sp. OttesenSCG-928-J18]|nr:lamin tail domain-containing protein [Parabacteroides sp. OttesenSCG-928-J18]